MNCLEAQSKIIAFIDGKLPDDELKEFIKHVKTCDNCAEELEIYYTLIVGTRQLDNQQHLSSDFKLELENKMDDEMDRMTTVKRIATSTMTIILAAVIAGLSWTYNGILDKVYGYEQRVKANSQSEYYYLDSFGDELFNKTSIDIQDIKKMIESKNHNITGTEELSNNFYDKIKEYNKTHENYQMIIDKFKQEQSEMEGNTENE